MQSDPSIRKVLIYRLGSLGDTIVALPCLHLIARSFPQAERRMLTNFPVHAKAPASAAVIGDSGLVHSYMRYSYGTRSLGELLRLAKEIRDYKPDVLVYLIMRPSKGVLRDRLFFRFAGVKRIVGLPADEDLKRHLNEATGMYEPEFVRLARPLRELGDAAPTNLANWDMKLNTAEHSAAAQALATLQGRPLILCGPGTKMQAKDWGQENWRALLTRLYERYPGYGLALIGAKEDRDVSEYAASDWSGPKVNLCGELAPRETAAVFELASRVPCVFLGPDSGPMHLAAAAGISCVIAFSARGLPGVWYPIGQQHEVIYHKTSCFGCNLETCVTENRRCITSITVEEMLEAIERVLSRQASLQRV